VVLLVTNYIPKDGVYYLYH